MKTTMNDFEQIQEIANALWIEGIRYTVTYDGDSSPEIKIETIGYYTVRTTPEEGLALDRLDKEEFSTKSVATMIEVLIYKITR
jgi:hypothetical protein